MARAIFISYRRNDAEGEAGRLFDDLVRAFGDDSVFMDVAGISPGADFRKAIDDNVASCGVLLAVIGPQWTTATDSSGKRRLEDENDFVRLETASALARNIPVIPVLVHGAKVPRPEDLPENLKELSYRNSVELTHARWNSDVHLLTTALQKYVGPSSTTDTEPVHATIPVQLPPPSTEATDTAAVVPSKSGMKMGLAAGVVLLIALAGFFALRHRAAPDERRNRSNDPVQEPAQDPRDSPVGSEGGTGLVGTWTNPTPEVPNGLAKLAISSAGGGVSMHAWGSCAGCDWGNQAATVAGDKATAAWTVPQQVNGQPSGRVAKVTVTPSGSGLAVHLENDFPKRKPTERDFQFARTQ